MKISRHSHAFNFLLVLLVFTSAQNMVSMVEGGCQLAVKGGGCPEVNRCVETCRPCYRGVGQITAFCRSAGGGIPFDECVCYFSHGAPCNLPAPPQCPAHPTNNNMTLA
ncbi:uncharacterized protein LOC120147639 isoform X1 [Hibiscus syriacus]|uniref:uncharacterized protein LOC120147639 isoform X1 n=1 Tax=Hibiscus syriacus TaxID=106335 RepID=UPI00192425BC|nr:uncharacterized protein LOC120147639 isoform X1 [Hibiscus syriacus]